MWPSIRNVIIINYHASCDMEVDAIIGKIAWFPFFIYMNVEEMQIKSLILPNFPKRYYEMITTID